MAGRRLRNTVRQALVAADPTLENATIVIAGLSNEVKTNKNKQEWKKKS